MLDAGERLVGVLAFSDVLAARRSASAPSASDLAREPVVAFADETLREVADRMVSSGHGVLPVTDRENPPRLVGLVSQFDLLKAHERVLIEERHRERPLGPRRQVAGPRQAAPITSRSEPDSDEIAAATADRPLLDEDYQRLLAFRSELRDFLRWSEQTAHDAGLTPSLHQLLLVMRGHPDDARTDDRTGRRGAAHTPSQRRRARPARGEPRV